MGQGRKKKPTALHVVQGTDRPDRTNKNEPQPKRGTPKPKILLLSPETRKIYYRIGKILDDMGVITEADVLALELLAETIDEYEMAKAALFGQEREGDEKPVIVRDGESMVETYQTKNGSDVSKRETLYGIMVEARRTIASFMATFGLTPSSRASINIVPKLPDKKGKWDKLPKK